MLDTKGPEIRTGFFAEGKTITLKKDQELELTTDYSVVFCAIHAFKLLDHSTLAFCHHANCVHHAVES